MDTRNVNLRDLQQLNDAILNTVDAIQRVSPQVAAGLAHAAFAQPFVGVNPYFNPIGLGAFSSPLQHAAIAAMAANPVLAQAAYAANPLAAGMAHSPFAPTGLNPFLLPLTHGSVPGLAQVPARFF